jgi:hypothetical protein
MGYYPTPTSVVYRIRSFLSFPAGHVSMLDPCCGEGAALGSLAEGARATTYGIELDGHRATQARGVLDHVLHCGYEDARISNSAFSCLFLNPPYDWQEAERPQESGQERTEKAFLKGTVRYLMPEGMLVYIVPQPRVTGDVARILSYRFEDVNTYRFPDGEYEQFKQIVLFGRKRRGESFDDRSLEAIGRIPHSDLPEIPSLEEPIYRVPGSSGVRLFRSTLIDEAELEKELMSSALWGKLNQHPHSDNGSARPPLPLHAGHLGLLLASGCLDGVIGEGDDRHVVRGKVQKVSHIEQDYEGEVLVQREVEQYRVSIKVLTADGQIRDLM